MAMLTASALRAIGAGACCAEAGRAASAVDMTSALVANKRYFPFFRLRGDAKRGRTNMMLMSFRGPELNESGGALAINGCSR